MYYSFIVSFSANFSLGVFWLLMSHCWCAEAGRGSITKRDLQRVTVAHDFLWTDEELVDMVHFFDSDGDGKVSTCCFLLL